MDTNGRLSLRTGLCAFAFTECLLICPAAFFILVATVHSMRPGEYELAHGSAIIFEWMKSHLTRTHAAIMFIIFPAVAFTLGTATELAFHHRQCGSSRWSGNFNGGSRSHDHGLNTWSCWLCCALTHERFQ